MSTMPVKRRSTGGRLWARPVFRVSDVAESISYYCEKLGFAKDWDEGGTDSARAANTLREESIARPALYAPRSQVASQIHGTIRIESLPTIGCPMKVSPTRVITVSLVKRGRA